MSPFHPVPPRSKVRRFVMKHVNAVLILLSLFVLATASMAQDESATSAPPPGTASIEGTVRDTNGNLIQGAAVGCNLSSRDAQKKIQLYRVTASTDRRGVYAFVNLPAMKGYLNVEAEGFNRPCKRMEIKEGERITGVDFVLQAERTISGCVRDKDGNPIEGVHIAANFESPGEQQGGPARSGEDGTYIIRRLGDGIYTVRASSDLYAPERKSGVVAGSGNVDFTMRGAGGLCGTVRDAATSRPIEEAHITVRITRGSPAATQDSNFASNPDLNSMSHQLATSDSEGFYECASLATGLYTLEANAEGYAKAVRRGVPVKEGEETEGVDFSLAPKPRVRGTVTIEGGGPAAGAEVNLTEAGFMSDLSFMFFMGGQADAVADGQGRYEIVKGEPGKKYVVRAFLAGYIPAASEPFQLLPGKDVDGVDLLLKKGFQVSGMVTDESGNPVSGGRVKASKRGGLFGSNVSMSLDGAFPKAKGPGTAFTDAAGSFILDGLEKASYDVAASAEGYSSARVEDLKVSEETRGKPIVLVLKSGLTISGKVTDASGSPLAAVSVSAHGRGDAGYCSRRATTGEDGRYEVTSLAPGTYTVSARLKGYEKEKVERVTPPAKEVNIVLSGGGRIAGRVTEKGTGKPVTSFRYDTDKGPHYGSIVFGHGMEVSPPDGTFETKELDPGDYAVKVAAEGYAPGMVEGVTVESGKTAKVEIELGTEASISGQVISEKEKKPVAGARVALLDPESEGLFGISFGDQDLLREPILSDEGGAFRIGDLPAGSFRLKVSHPDFADELKAVELKKEGDEAKVEITLKKGRVISGTVLDTSGSKPVAGARVSLSPQGEMGSGILSTILAPLVARYGRAAVSDSGGRWEFSNVAPDEYRLSATHDSYAPSETKDVSVKPDADMRDVVLFLVGGARVKGTVRDNEGKPIPSLEVHVVGQGVFKEARTDSSGAYALEHLAAGSCTISIEQEEREKKFAGMSKQLELAPGDDVLLDFTLQKGFSVSGRVVRDGKPAGGVLVVCSREESGEGVSATGKSGSDGSYRVDGLVPGSYEVTLFTDGEGKGAVSKMPRPLVLTGDLTGYDLTIPGGAVGGTVVDENGNPLKGARVNLKKRGEGERQRTAAKLEEVLGELFHATSDANGAFELGGLAAGSYLVTAAAKGFGQAVETVTLDSDTSRAETRLVLKPGVDLVMKLACAEKGKALKRATVRVTDARGQRVKTETVSVEDGLVTVAGLAVGTYRVEAVAEGCAPGTLDAVSIGQGVQTPAELALKKGGVLAVSVTDDKGAPFMGAVLELSDAAGKPYDGLRFSEDKKKGWDVTGSKGTATIGCLPEGSFTVKAAKAGYSPAEGKASLKKGEEKKLSLTLKKK
jgi:protocatechuate 3,4-dioxygenase beta subunit